MPIRRIDIRHFSFLPCNRKSAIEIRQFLPGGIAQLVERQLCKLEVRGSNPLASKASGVEASSSNRGGLLDALAGKPVLPSVRSRREPRFFHQLFLAAFFLRSCFPYSIS